MLERIIFEVEMHLTPQWDIYDVLTQVTNISQKIRGSSFNAYLARRFENVGLFQSFFFFR